MPRFTLDTNVLVYSFDVSAGSKHDLARRIVALSRGCDCCLTLQAVSEFFSVATRKQLVSRVEAVEAAGRFLDVFPAATHTASSVRTAFAHAVAGRLSFWDAQLVATAAEAGCGAVLSEDMADGARFGGVEIVNPFAGDALSLRAAALLGPGEAAP
jgi:predicted nucleic acid-binding protein